VTKVKHKQTEHHRISRTATHTHIATLLRKGLTTLLVTHTHTGTLLG